MPDFIVNRETIEDAMQWSTRANWRDYFTLPVTYKSTLKIADIALGEIYYPTNRTGEMKVKTKPSGGRCLEKRTFTPISEHTIVVRVLV